jgi:AsmA protein
MKLKSINNKEPVSLHRKILKILTYLALALVILLSSVLIYFFINRDEIGRDLLLKLNEIQNGEIIFEKIAFAPFAQFPKISLNLVNVSYFENIEASQNNKENPICEFENLYLAFNFSDLLDGNINVTNITLKSGHVRILTYPDTTINFIKAIASNKDPEPEEEIFDEQEDTLKAKSELEHFLTINKLTIKNVTMVFENRVFERKTSFHVNNFTASFSHKAKRNKLKLAADLELEFYQLEGVTLLRDKSIQLAVDLLYHGKEKLINIEPSNFIFEGARFDIDGSVDITDEGEMDLQLKLADKDFSLLSFVLREDVIHQNRKNLLKGDFYFEANVRGKTYNEIPFIDLRFGVKNVNLHMPKVGKSIKDLNFDAYLTTGNKRDFSEAYFKLKNFSAQLPDGNTRGTLTLENIKKPYINLDWYLKTDLSGFNDLFKIDLIDNLGGIITIDTEMEGEVDLEEGRIIGDKSKANLTFENVSIRFPEVISLDKINGVIKREDKNLRLEEFHVITEKTDITLNGIIKNILFLLFNIEYDITADLTLVSDIFDLPEVFAFDPSVGRSFNHIIKELDLKVTAKSTTAKLLNFDSFPAIDFKIDLLDVSFDDFPDMKIINSDIDFYDDTSGFNIKFDPLNIHTAKGELTLKGAYNGSEWKPYYLISDTKAKNIHMLDLLNQFEMDLDSTSFFNSILNGNFDAKLEFPKDSIIFKTLRMADADLTIYDLAEDDTVISKSLTINLNNVYYDLDRDSNPMATLTTSGMFNAERFRTNQFDVDNIKLDVSAKSGLYEIVPNSEIFFGSRGHGAFISQPWSKIPSYQLKYSVEQFAIEDWLANFMKDPVISGTMSFSIDIQMTGDNWDNLVKELNGSIYSEGKDLRLHGLNVDEVLKKIERSRNFTLLDVGAVVFAGPVGLAVTKGADLTALIAGDPGEVTPIPKLVSSWEISKGILKINDVAFATNKNRIAATGHVNIVDETLNITFAVLNEDGSSRLNQNIYGNLDNPKLGEIKVIATLLVPVTNLFNSILSIQGETFYEGSVKHPE